MKVTAWVGTILSVIGSFTVALGFFLIGYMAFLLGALAWCLVALDNKDYALFTLNVIFTSANLLGLARALGAI